MSAIRERGQEPKAWESKGSGTESPNRFLTLSSILTPLFYLTSLFYQLPNDRLGVNLLLLAIVRRSRTL
jgi:hypothetical protein